MKNLLKTLEVYWDRRMLVIFLLGISSGFPWVIIGSAMSLWLKDAGLSRSAIGFVGGVGLFFGINFLWAPLVDRLRLPLLRRMGQRRSWILVTQSAILAGCLLMSLTDPRLTVWWPAVLAAWVAFFAATQDVAIDAYRIEILTRDEAHKFSATSAMAVCGWWSGYGFLGGLALILSDVPGMDWGAVYVALAAVVAVLMCVVLLIPEPPDERRAVDEALAGRYANPVASWLYRAVAMPFTELFRRNGAFALAILLFLLLFKLGDAYLGRMSILFYSEIGFSNTEIAEYSKILGVLTTGIFSIVASLLSLHLGWSVVRTLFISGIAMSATNLMFAWLAVVGKNEALLAAAVVLDNFTTAFGSVAFVAFISFLCDRAYTATQYSLMASVASFGRTSLAAGSGAVVDALGGNWALFFVLTAVAVLPSLALLALMAKRIHTVYRDQGTEL